jgi:hypothetical protein
MRFKKLKILVAISLIVFLLIIANTIIFGSLQNNKDIQSKLVAPIDWRKNSPVVQAINSSQSSINKNSQESQSSTATNSSASQTTDTAQNNSQATVISHPATRTRAS